MKRLLLCLVLIGCSSIAFAQDHDLSASDGADWEGHSEGFKIGYASGFLSAMGDAQMYSAIFCQFQLGQASDSPTAKSCAATTAEFNYAKINVGQFVQGVDVFYKDFRNTKFPVHAAFRLVRDEINGRPAEDVEKEMVSWRACHADSSKCVPYITPDPPPAAK